jgi:hypothetical protein
VKGNITVARGAVLIARDVLVIGNLPGRKCGEGGRQAHLPRRRRCPGVQNTGGVEIYHNRIGGNLQCKENRPDRSAVATSSMAAGRTSAVASEPRVFAR